MEAARDYLGSSEGGEAEAGAGALSWLAGVLREEAADRWGGSLALTLLQVLRIWIRIRRIHMFLGLLDPDPLVRGMDPDPSIIKQK